MATPIRKTIAIIGSLNIDLVTTTSRVPTGGETMTAQSFSTGSGGKGANQAVACARVSRLKPSSPSETSASDVLVKMLGAVGADEFGPSLISGLKADGIDTSGIKVVEGERTGVAVILVETPTGENRILLSPGANHTLSPSDFAHLSSLGTPLPDLIILQLEIPLQTVLQILKIAKEAGVSVLLNPAPAVELNDQVLGMVDHLIVNESEAAILARAEVKELEDTGWGEVMKDFIRKGAKNVIVTLGGKGAVFMSAENMEEKFVPAAKVDKVVDTTAAGDTFVGAYAVSVVRKGNGCVDEEAVKFACMAAARTVEKEGAQSAIPWSDEIDRNMRSF